MWKHEVSVVAFFSRTSFSNVDAVFRTNRCTQAQTENIPEAEMYALQDFFLSTNGTFWSWVPGNESGTIWNFTADANPCADNWQGVTCTVEIAGEDRHITELALADYNLRGTMPDSIGNWTYLERLFLPNNFLDGPLPINPWTMLSNLTYLDLNINFHTGGIPATLGQLKRLTVLELTLNQLNGTIPATLGDLSNLIVLRLGYNSLRGTIPPSLGQLFHLEILSLFYTYLSGSIPAELGGLRSLIELEAFHTHLTGTLPDSLGQLTNLTSLVVSNGRFNGSIPETLCELTKLLEFGLGGNQLNKCGLH